MPRVYYILLIVVFASNSTKAQSYDYSIGQQIEKIDSVYEYLLMYEQLGIKSTGSSELVNARNWLKTKYEQYGYTEVVYDTFNFNSNSLQNIIIEKPGLDPNKWIVICAHYDSYPGSRGANDNGSGVVCCLQIARIMKDIETEVGIRFIHFSAEENGLVGSTHYVANTLNANDQIELILNLDQLGGTKNENNSKIVCERDENPTPSSNNAVSWAKTDTLAQLVRTYSNLEPKIDKAYSSDYVPFQDSGYIITGLYQESYYPFYHQDNDYVSNMDVDATEQVIQCALAAAMYFSRNTLPLSTHSLQKSITSISPNPASSYFRLKGVPASAMIVECYNQYGQLVKRWDEMAQNYSISELANGIYFIRIRDEQNMEIKRSRLIIAH